MAKPQSQGAEQRVGRDREGMNNSVQLSTPRELHFLFFGCIGSLLLRAAFL